MTNSAIKTEKDISPQLGEMLAKIGYTLSKLNTKDRMKIVDEVIVSSEKKFKNYK